MQSYQKESENSELSLRNKNKYFVCRYTSNNVHNT